MNHVPPIDIQTKAKCEGKISCWLPYSDALIVKLELFRPPGTDRSGRSNNASSEGAIRPGTYADSAWLILPLMSLLGKNVPGKKCPQENVPSMCEEIEVYSRLTVCGSDTKNKKIHRKISHCTKWTEWIDPPHTEVTVCGHVCSIFLRLSFVWLTILIPEFSTDTFGVLSESVLYSVYQWCKYPSVHIIYVFLVIHTLTVSRIPAADT